MTKGSSSSIWMTLSVGNHEKSACSFQMRDMRSLNRIHNIWSPLTKDLTVSS